MYPETFALGLTGWPLTYSLSPAIHTAALNALHLEGEYRLFPVPPLPAGREAMLNLLERLRSGELDGLNVTIPHKQVVMECLDELTPLVKAVGAANLIYRQGMRLVGDNTDVIGFLADLKTRGAVIAAQPHTGCRRPAARSHSGGGRRCPGSSLRAGWIGLARHHSGAAVRAGGETGR